MLLCISICITIVGGNCGGGRSFTLMRVIWLGVLCVTFFEITVEILGVQQILLFCVKWFYSWNGSSWLCVFPSVLALLFCHSELWLLKPCRCASECKGHLWITHFLGSPNWNRKTFLFTSISANLFHLLFKIAALYCQQIFIEGYLESEWDVSD